MDIKVKFEGVALIKDIDKSYGDIAIRREFNAKVEEAIIGLGASECECNSDIWRNNELS